MEKQPKQNHAGFQFNTNPMEMTEFEKRMKRQEEYERAEAKRQFTLGIQGVDGGRFPNEAS